MTQVRLALAGNQNSGKTTLFNVLTGSNQHVGNFPGVTVEKKVGVLKDYKEASLVDLPGIYSLSPYTNEEVVTRDYILREHPDVIINIVDATNIERNLYLSLQLMELEVPMVIALNMMDEVEKSGNSIDVEGLSKQLGIAVVPISAARKKGINDLIRVIKRMVKHPSAAPKCDFCSGEVHRAIHAIAHIVEDHAQDSIYPLRFAATKLVEGDAQMHKALSLHADDIHIIEDIVASMERALGTDREAALADMRYTYIEDLCRVHVHKNNETYAQHRSEQIDRLLTHKYLGIPIFVTIMFLIFYLTFSVFGAYLQEWMEWMIDSFTGWLSVCLEQGGVSPWLKALLIDGLSFDVGG